MKRIMLSLFFGGLAMSLSGQTNECMLGLGGKDTETIIQVFQLNEEQVRKMEEFRAELSVANKAYKEEIQQLFDTHPQSKMEELEALATKYKALKDRVLENARQYDIRMLQLFNSRQYDRYLELCAAARRVPYEVSPRLYPEKVPE